MADKLRLFSGKKEEFHTYSHTTKKIYCKYTAYSNEMAIEGRVYSLSSLQIVVASKCKYFDFSKILSTVLCFVTIYKKPEIEYMQ